jgi:transcription elongation factor GreB
MSRGFVKEDDQEETPPVPQRAYLPEGMTNLVTQAGMNQLLDEKQMLISEKENLISTNENEKRISLNLINARLLLLNDRIASAKIVNPKEQQQDEIRFGAKITLRDNESRKVQTFQIVGVDEADISKGKISFISPLAKALINKRSGDIVFIKRNKADISFEVLEIAYH